MVNGPRLRHELDGIPAYKAGQPPTLRPGLRAFKLSSNENHHDPLPSVVAAIGASLDTLHRYPDYGSGDLVRAIATHFCVPEEHVSVGTGSVALLQQLIQITADPDSGVLFAWRSFEAYPIMTQIAGAWQQRVALDASDRHDLDAMFAAIDDRTRLIMVCNPNNPTSTAVDGPALEAFLDAVPPDILVVVDEAYREFVNPQVVPDGLELYRNRPNVAVLRTFSKAYGLAGLRVGFCVAHEPVAEALRKVQLPFGVSTMAQVAAVASLRHESELLDRVDRIVAERERVMRALRAVGLTPAESEANFVWLRLGSASTGFADACDEAGLSVRPFENEGVRITIGEPEANTRFIDVATSWAGRRTA